MAVDMGMPMGVLVIVAVGAGMGSGRHGRMLYYNVTKVHRRPKSTGALTAVFPNQTPAGHAAGTFSPQASPGRNANEKGRQLDAAALLHFNGLSAQAFDNSSST
jgi:hypothetical protein